MDNHKDAIKLINDLKIEVISADNHDLVSGESEIPNNPLHNVLYEILFEVIIKNYVQESEEEKDLHSLLCKSK
ncbi:TPA: hypothetical protein RWI32_002465 [Staphylococcus aureus]|nr:hypothetical protein [Staphylococcus aureus]HEA3944465.1 hypothetical protein [Staphylococcus aureus]